MIAERHLQTSEVNTTTNGADVRFKNMNLGSVTTGGGIFWTVSYAVQNETPVGVIVIVLENKRSNESLEAYEVICIDTAVGRTWVQTMNRQGEVIASTKTDNRLSGLWLCTRRSASTVWISHYSNRRRLKVCWGCSAGMHTILDVAMDGYLNIAQTIVRSTRATGQIHLPCTIEYAAIPDGSLGRVVRRLEPTRSKRPTHHESGRTTAQVQSAHGTNDLGYLCAVHGLRGALRVAASTTARHRSILVNLLML
jgi:hypothetical protein